MIDLGLLRNDPDKIIDLIKRKENRYNAQLLYEQDKYLRDLRVKAEELRHQKNELAEQGKKGISPQIRQQSIELSALLKRTEHELNEVEASFQKLYLSCPNLPQEDLPIGGKEANRVVKQVGQKPAFSFPIKNHVELGEKLEWFDFQTAAKMTGSNFVLYKNEAVNLIYALMMMMLEHNKANGFSIVLPPYLVNEKSLEVAGNFPKFKDQCYHIQEDNLYLIPTAEASLANIYRDSILEAKELPIRMASWTSCFRREAGSYGAVERGLIRIHEFEKVELFTICRPEESTKELDALVSSAEQILQKLGLTYRISLLATEDCSFSSAKTYDLEVWMPGQDAWFEVSSCSNCTDFQARRGAIRYRKSSSSKPELVHTLNGSSLALPRLMVALMETYQQPDGTIAIPSQLKEYGIWSRTSSAKDK